MCVCVCVCMQPPTKQEQLMLPASPYKPRVNRPDRSGLFGYQGDTKDTREELERGKQTFLMVPMQVSLRW